MSICCGPHILTTVGDIIRYIPKKSVTDDTPALRAPRKRIRYTTGKIRYKWHSNTTGADQSGTPAICCYTFSWFSATYIHWFPSLICVIFIIIITTFGHLYPYLLWFWLLLLWSFSLIFILFSLLSMVFL